MGEGGVEVFGQVFGQGRPVVEYAACPAEGVEFVVAQAYEGAAQVAKEREGIVRGVDGFEEVQKGADFGGIAQATATGNVVGDAAFFQGAGVGVEVTGGAGEDHEIAGRGLERKDGIFGIAVEFGVSGDGGGDEVCNAFGVLGDNLCAVVAGDFFDGDAAYAVGVCAVRVKFEEGCEEGLVAFFVLGKEGFESGVDPVAEAAQAAEAGVEL